MRIFTAIAAAAIGLAAPMQAAAQDDASAATASARLTLAREIIDNGFPPETRMGMFDDVIDQLLVQMQASLPDLGRSPQMAAAFDQHIARVQATSMDVLSRHIDPIMEGMVIAYAEQFTVEELRGLHTFIVSPEGHGFLARTTAIGSHPAFAAANQAYLEEYFSHMPELMGQLEQDLERIGEKAGRR